MANDVSVAAAKFDPASIPAEAHEFNEKLMEIMRNGPKWYQVGAEKYRQMRDRGETPLPATVFLDSAETITIPSREQDRTISCRVLRPENDAPAKGVYMHIHGGGWVLQHEASQDQYLQNLANSTGLLAISVGYRLAPEHPFPAGPDDCYDAAEWLVNNAEATLKAPLLFIGGESAGAHLSLLTVLHLLQHQQPRFSKFAFRGVVLHFGCFDLTMTPSVYTFNPPSVLVLDRDLIEHYLDVVVPGLTLEQKRHPGISPMYANFNQLRGRLPPTLFTCGTEDPLLDDTVFMSGKWIAAGAEAVVKIIPGAAHGYISFPRSLRGSRSNIGLDAVDEFINNRL